MKNVILTAVILLGASLSFAEVSYPDPGQPNDPVPPPVEQEVLLGFLSSSEGLTFQVTSGGCTDHSSFDVVVQETYPPLITLNRINYDNCRMYLPHGTTIFYSFEQLGIHDGIFNISNEIIPGFAVIQ